MLLSPLPVRHARDTGGGAAGGLWGVGNELGAVKANWNPHTWLM